MDALNIAGVSIKPSSYVRDLGVYVDGDLSLEAHISHLSRTCFYHLCQLRVVRRSLTTDSAHSLIRALVYSRVDYCNGVLAGLPQTKINRLQSILRAAARLVLLLPGWASVSNLMRVQLHWLSIPQRIQFKLCSVVYCNRCLHNTAPIYLRDLCVPISSLEGRSNLRSAAAGDLRIPSASRGLTIATGSSVALPRSSSTVCLVCSVLRRGSFSNFLEWVIYRTRWKNSYTGSTFRHECVSNCAPLCSGASTVLPRPTWRNVAPVWSLGDWICARQLLRVAD